MRFKKIAISTIAGLFLVSSVYAEQGVDQGAGRQQSLDQQQSGSIQGGRQPGEIEGQNQQQGTDRGGTAGGAMGSTQDPAAIQQIQKKLNDQGFNAGPVDGKFGPKTQAALRKFQQAQGFQATGQMDPQTMAALGIQGPGQGGAKQGETPPGGTAPGETQPGMGSGQPGEKGAGPSSPGTRTPSPDAGTQKGDQQSSDAGARQQ